MPPSIMLFWDLCKTPPFAQSRRPR